MAAGEDRGKAIRLFRLMLDRFTATPVLVGGDPIGGRFGGSFHPRPGTLLESANGFKIKTTCPDDTVYA